MTNDLEAISARHAATTPGMWIVRSALGLSPFVQAPKANGLDPYDIEILADPDGLYSEERHAADVEFVAKAHQDVPNLIQEIEELRTLLGADSYPPRRDTGHNADPSLASNQTEWGRIEADLQLGGLTDQPRKVS